MFGYVTPDKPYLTLRDFALYRSVYCGICCSLKKNYGQISRLATTYDAVFLSLLLHNYLDSDYAIEKKRCILHPIKKRTIAQPNEIDDVVCAFNLLLMYHKIGDDVEDEHKFRSKAARTAFGRAYKKAKKTYPEMDEIIRRQYATMSALEQENCDSIDRVADPFSVMLAEMTRLVLKEKFTQDIYDFCYNVGKWIYLIDALDDIDEDFKRGGYNPYLAKFDDYISREQFINTHKQEISYYLNSAIAVINDKIRKIPFAFNIDLLMNITARGLSGRTKTIMESNCKCKTMRI